MIMSFLAFLLALLAVAATAQTPSGAGFLSIDCGLDSVFGYTSKFNDLFYSPDEPYISTGVNQKVSSATNISGINEYYATLRSFPLGKRHCYTLSPVQPGSKYRIEAQFFYGNYDGLSQPPRFDLYLGVNLWTTVETGDLKREEIITVAYADNIQVCLVNTGSGTPFISTLELRPLSFSMYEIVNVSSLALVRHQRRNLGGEDQITYPYNIYDRRRFPRSIGRSINTSQSITPLNGSSAPMPQSVLQTAAEAFSLTDSLNISAYGSQDQSIVSYMHFAEFRLLATKESREFSIYAGTTQVIRSFRPRYLEQDVICTVSSGLPGGLTYFLRATNNSTLPPILNAIEIFRLIRMPILPTNQRDVKAIMRIKNQYGVSRNWEGDPCVPRKQMWEGLTCGYDSFNYSTITSLDLSGSGLSGEIPLSIANLTSFTSLDLSNNNLSGEIPDSLGNLTSLKTLYLRGYNLGSPVRKILYERFANGSVVVRATNNTRQCNTTYLCTSESSTTKKSVGVPIAIAVSVILVIIISVVFAFCIFKRRKIQQRSFVELNQSPQHGNYTPQIPSARREIHSESNQFSEADISKITSNFERPIGQGGFGTVFYGILDDGTEVAVKLVAKQSVHGEKQFRAEAELLTRVHHRYLVSLLGYCKENMALVYEFLRQGSLADHLSGDSANRNILSWSVRLKIALEAAQGLDYLHNGCIPPIIHRDVKPANFLLNENFEVKIADFGLSRSFSDGRNTFQSTMIAGTPGYLDPEYQQTNRFSESSDVYSFGIVLLQLATGKPPISNSPPVIHITKEVKTKIEKGDIDNIADPRMQGNFDVQSMWRIIEIGLSCTSFNSIKRPTMSDIVAQLKECLAAASSTEYTSGTSSSTFAMYPDYSMTYTSPAAR